MTELEAVPLKDGFLLAVLKLELKDSFGYNKEIERWEKPSL